MACSDSISSSRNIVQSAAPVISPAPAVSPVPAISPAPAITPEPAISPAPATSLKALQGVVVPTYPDGEAVSPIVEIEDSRNTDNGREEEEKQKQRSPDTSNVKQCQDETGEIRDPMPDEAISRSLLVEKSGDAQLSSLTQEVYSRLCDWMRVIHANEKVEGLCQRVLEAFALTGEGAAKLLSGELAGLYLGLHKLYDDYKTFTTNQDDVFKEAFPYCRDHLTILLLEQGVKDECYALLLRHYLLGDVDHTEEAWRNLDNCPPPCGSISCSNMSPEHEYCSVACEQKAAEERENAASAAKEQAEEARAAKMQVEVARASEKVAKPKKVLTSTKTTAVKVKQYPIGDGSSLAKSVRFCPTEEIKTLGRALDDTNMTIHDLIFLISRLDDECNRSGKRKHRHQL